MSGALGQTMRMVIGRFHNRARAPIGSIGHGCLLALTLTLAACGPADPPPAARVELGAARPVQEQPLPSPDTSGAMWQLDRSGLALRFGTPGTSALLTLACLRDGAAPRLALIRHAHAFPGQAAIFPVIGNGERSRFLADAARAGGRWQWRAEVPTSDPRLAVFEGEGPLLATLPGKGTLAIAGSPAPGAFVARCRAGGRAPAAEG